MGERYYNSATGNSEKWEGTDGAGHVLGDMGTGFGIAQNRADTGLSTTRSKMTFPANSGPTKINVRYESGTAGQKAYVVINATSDQHADNELANPPSQDATAERYTIFDTAVHPQGLEISSITNIDRIDYLLSSADANSTFIVEGA